MLQSNKRKAHIMVLFSEDVHKISSHFNTQKKVIAINKKLGWWILQLVSTFVEFSDVREIVIFLYLLYNNIAPSATDLYFQKSLQR